jgi:hypothetical protein
VDTDRDGRHVAQIEPDGFLGLGDDELTLPLSELTLTDDGDLRMSMTRDELRSHKERGGQRDKQDYDEHDYR